MSKISVIIPIYKVEKYLCQCLDSVINQTYKDLEIILIDDGSPDKCGMICDKYAAEDNRIKVIHKQNGGLSAARNDGIDVSSGKWIAFVDSDDWCELDYYEKMVSELGEMDVDIFFAGGHFVEFPDRQLKRITEINPILYNKKNDATYLQMRVLVPKFKSSENINLYSFGAPWDKLYNAEFIKGNNFKFDEKNKAWEDILFNFILFGSAEKTAVGSVCGYHYRQIQTSIMKQYNPNRVEINNYFLREVYNWINKNNCCNQMLLDAVNARSISLFANLLKTYLLNKQNAMSYSEKKKKIEDAKNIEYYKKAINSKSDNYLSFGQKVLKRMLKCKSIIPLIILNYLKVKCGRI